MQLSAIVITKNEEKMIGDCLRSLQFADEIVVVDNGNTDRTNQIARSLHSQVIASKGGDYSAVRNDGQKFAKGEWLLFVDADERVPDDLAIQIKKTISSPSSHSAYALPRKNFYLGK